MATYVVSDMHGHARTFERLLERVSLGSQDQLYILGDMIDRGPDPARVLKVCHDLYEAGAQVLRGNHEQLMLDALTHPNSAEAQYDWVSNGGAFTAESFDNYAQDEVDQLIAWVEQLPYYAYTFVGDRPYILVHAGINPKRVKFVQHLNASFSDGAWTAQALETLLAAQDPEDLLWIREAFWQAPTGLLNSEGKGPIVVAGHTPVINLDHFLGKSSSHLLGMFTKEPSLRKLGASELTGHVADKWDIDCAAAAGPGIGRILMVRLDDEQCFYESVLDGE